MIYEESRVCSKCMEEKPIEEFRYLNTQGRYLAHCKECERKKARKYYAEKTFTPEELANRKEVSQRRHAIRSVAYYLGKYGDEIINEAKKQIEDKG